MNCACALRAFDQHIPECEFVYDHTLTREAVLEASQRMARRIGTVWLYANLIGFKLADMDKTAAIVRQFSEAFARRTTMTELSEYMKLPSVIRILAADKHVETQVRAILEKRIMEIQRI